MEREGRRMERLLEGNRIKKEDEEKREMKERQGWREEEKGWKEARWKCRTG